MESAEQGWDACRAHTGHGARGGKRLVVVPGGSLMWCTGWPGPLAVPGRPARATEAPTSMRAIHHSPSLPCARRRKKDHGRAEALLLAAWGLGVRMQPIGGGGASGSAADAAADSEPEDDGLEEADG